MPHLTTDGYLSACDMALFGAEDNHMKALIYGKWNPETATVEYFYDRLNKIRNRKIENLPHCLKCSANQYCGGYCLGETLNEYTYKHP